MSESKRLTIRLGTLAAPLEAAAKAAGISEGDYTKQALADALGCEYERLPAGGPITGSELARIRWNKHKKN